MKENKLILLGFYGSINFGDEVILENLYSLYKDKFSKNLMTVCCMHSWYVESKYSVPCFHLGIGRGWRYLWIFFKNMRKNNLLVIGGGGLLQDYGCNLRPIYEIMIRVFIAAILRKPVLFYSVGVGPIETKTGKVLIKIFSRFVKLFTVRDDESKIILTKLGVKESTIHVLPDPAFAIKKSLCTTIIKENRKNNNCVGISILPFYQLAHHVHYKDAEIRTILINACNYLIDKKGYSIIFLPCQERPDSEESMNIIKCINNRDKATVSNWWTIDAVNYDFFKKIDYLISMRLHPQIMASLFGIPFISIVYHPKIASLLKMLDYNQYSCDLASLTTDKILTFTQRIEINQKEISRHLIKKSDLIIRKFNEKEQIIRNYIENKNINNADNSGYYKNKN